MTLFGIPMSAHWSFWLLLVFIGGGTHAQSPGDWMEVALFVLAGTISIAVHELGHALVGRRYGGRGISIQFYAMGGLCSFQQANFSRLQSFLMTFAGPLAGYGLGVIALIVQAFLPPQPYMIDHLLAVFIIINFFWSTINLLPIFPLDGGQMLRAALGPRRLDLTLKIAILTAALCIPVSLQFGSIILPLFLGYSIWENVKILRSMPPRR